MVNPPHFHFLPSHPLFRNAHPGEDDDSPMEGVEMLMEMEMREGMVGHPMDDQQELHGEDGSVEVRFELS